MRLCKSWNGAEAEAAHQEQGHHGGHRVACQCSEGDQYREQGGNEEQQGAVDALVSHAATDPVAGKQANAEEHQQPGNAGLIESGDLGQGVGDVGESAEHFAVAQDGDRQGEPNLAVR